MSALQSSPFFQKINRTASGQFLLAALLGLTALQASPYRPDFRNDEVATWQPVKKYAWHRPPAPSGDTSITATICANDFYVLNGDTLRDAGQYSAVLVAADGTDSIVSLDLFV
ncbi:MAG: hypothetical protein ABIO24_14395, partial [Saprospiraceae bacterium]